MEVEFRFVYVYMLSLGVCEENHLAVSRGQFPHTDLEVGNVIWWLLVRFAD